MDWGVALVGLLFAGLLIERAVEKARRRGFREGVARGGEDVASAWGYRWEEYRRTLEHEVNMLEEALSASDEEQRGPIALRVEAIRELLVKPPF